MTGAIVVALGSEYAGLFSNNDNLSKQLFDAGEKVEEKVWRLPLHENYDKLMYQNKQNITIENKNKLLSNIQSYDLVDTLIREKFMYGKKGEVLIKTND